MSTSSVDIMRAFSDISNSMVLCLVKLLFNEFVIFVVVILELYFVLLFRLSNHSQQRDGGYGAPASQSHQKFLCGWTCARTSLSATRLSVCDMVYILGKIMK